MDINQLIQQGSAHAWLYLPTAVIIGALHGMEPGHSKTMMAAFIIAVRGTVWQAVLLGLSAAFSHSLVIWILAAIALHYGSAWNVETTEPYFQIVSGIIIVALALWMFWRTHRDQKASAAHGHDAEGPHGGKLIDTGHGQVEVSVFETGVPPRFRLYFFDARNVATKPDPSASVTIVTVRPEGPQQTFAFKAEAGYLEAVDELPEPHEFNATLLLAHGDHSHTYAFRFSESDHHHGHAHGHTHEGAGAHDHGHDHDHAHGGETKGLDVSDGDFQDAHERAHASDIAKRFSNRTVTTPQIILFGLTGGLLPCPAALTILLVCLQVKQVTLGFVLVLCFSLGLALTLVATGAVAAWSVRHASKRIKGFGEFARKAPYFSSALLVAMGLYIAIQGWRHLGP
jgi:nickel/cobalt transporter (NicO) family protein